MTFPFSVSLPPKTYPYITHVSDGQYCLDLFIYLFIYFPLLDIVKLWAKCYLVMRKSNDPVCALSLSLSLSLFLSLPLPLPLCLLRPFSFSVQLLSDRAHWTETFSFSSTSRLRASHPPTDLPLSLSLSCISLHIHTLSHLFVYLFILSGTYAGHSR